MTATDHVPQNQPTLTGTSHPHCLNSTEPDLLAAEVAEAVHQRESPLATFLFGSRARGDHDQEHSDLDILLVITTEEYYWGNPKAEKSAQEHAQTLYGREMEIQLLYISLKQFQEETRYINSSPTRAMLEGILFSDQPHDYTSPYQAEKPPLLEYQWDTYNSFLRTTKQGMNLINAYMEPHRVHKLPESPFKRAYITLIPTMSYEKRMSSATGRMPFVIKTALQAAISATGEIANNRAPATRLADTLQSLLPKENLSTAIPLENYEKGEWPKDTPPETLINMFIADTTKLRKLAMRTKRHTIKKALNPELPPD